LDVNARKGNCLPHEAGLRLLSVPQGEATRRMTAFVAGFILDGESLEPIDPGVKHVTLC